MARLSNILDPIRPRLAPGVWSSPGSKAPRLRPEVGAWIQKTVFDTLAKHGYTDAESWCSLVLTGSICTFQYSDDSDLDVSLFVDEHEVPDWSRSEMVGICTKYLDGQKYKRLPYPLQAYVVPNGVTRKDLYAPDLRSGYDLKTDKWIQPPERHRVRDVKKAQPEDYAWAIQQVDKMQLLLKHDPEKAEMLWDQIHRRRREDQKAGKGDFAQSNIVYKALANWGLLSQIAELTGEHIAKTASGLSLQNGNQGAELSPGKIYRTEPWEKGIWGKGLVHDGVAHIWAGEGYDEESEDYAHHWDVHHHLAPGGKPRDQDAFVIGADGTLSLAEAWDTNPISEDRLKEISRLHPDLKHQEGTRFVFGRKSALDHQAVLDANRGRNLVGLPQKVQVPGHGPVQFHSHQGIQDIATSYMREYGIEGQHPSEYVKVRPDVSKRIAEEYERMPHAPHDPEVRTSYDALKNETLAQYQHAVKNGYNFEFYPEKDPYPNSPREAVLDLHHNRHMYVYPTEDGFGSDDQDYPDHPLMTQTGLQWGGKPVTHNDLFRAVHDFYGHAKEGLGFRADGEDNAWRQHQAMFSPLAQRAMTAETRGQNSYVNFGPHGEANQTAGQADTVYAPQKAGILPEWVQDTNLHRTSRYEISKAAVQIACEHLGIRHPVVINKVSGTAGRYVGMSGPAHVIEVVEWLSPKSASKQIWHELAHAKQRERGEDHKYAWNFTGSTDEYRAQPLEVEARKIANEAPFPVTAALQHAKMVYDPIANKLVVGKDGALEGEVLTHAQLAKQHGIEISNLTQFGDVNSKGYAQVYQRPALVDKKNKDYNPNKARWDFAKAIGHAFPEAKILGHDASFNPQHWEKAWTPPELVGPRFETEKPDEGVQWQF